MKTKSIFKLSILLSLLAIAVLPMVSAISYADIFSFIGLTGAGGSILAIAAAGTVVDNSVNATGTVDTDAANEKSATLLVDSIRDNITKMKPASTPVDTILREMGMVINIESWESRYYSVDSRGFADAVATAVATSTGQAAGKTYDVGVGSIHIWNVDDTVLFQGIDGGSGLGDLVGHVTAVTVATSQLTFTPVNGEGTYNADIPEAIPTETVLVRLGNAKHEMDAQTETYEVLPQPESNYCQRFMAQVEESVFMRIHKKEVNYNIEDYRMQALYDFKLSQELTILFGAKGRTKISASRYIHHMNGITKLITGTSTYASAGTMALDDIYTWSKDIFSLNSGSQKRYMFCGGDFLAEMSALDVVQKQMSATNTEVKFGITFNNLVTNFGQLHIMHHDLLNSVGWGEKAIVLDMANIEKHVFKPLETRKLELIASGQRNANAYILDETYTVATRYPATHRIIAPAA